MLRSIYVKIVGHGCSACILCTRQASSTLLKPHPRPFKFRQWAKTMRPIAPKWQPPPFIQPHTNQLSPYYRDRAIHVKRLFNDMQMMAICHLLSVGPIRKRLLLGGLMAEGVFPHESPPRVMEHVFQGRLGQLSCVVHSNTVYIFADSSKHINTIVKYCNKHTQLILMGCVVEDTILTKSDMEKLVETSMELQPAYIVSITRSVPQTTLRHISTPAFTLSGHLQSRKQQLEHELQ